MTLIKEERDSVELQVCFWPFRRLSDGLDLCCKKICALLLVTALTLRLLFTASELSVSICSTVRLPTSRQSVLFCVRDDHCSLDLSGVFVDIVLVILWQLLDARLEGRVRNSRGVGPHCSAQSSKQFKNDLFEKSAIVDSCADVMLKFGGFSGRLYCSFLDKCGAMTLFRL
jgi:hypothetical protein